MALLASRSWLQPALDPAPVRRGRPRPLPNLVVYGSYAQGWAYVPHAGAVCAHAAGTPAPPRCAIKAAALEATIDTPEAKAPRRRKTSEPPSEAYGADAIQARYRTSTAACSWQALSNMYGRTRYGRLLTLTLEAHLLLTRAAVNAAYCYFAMKDTRTSRLGTSRQCCHGMPANWRQISLPGH